MCKKIQSRTPVANLRGQSHAIHCNNGKEINIISANYGRLTGGHVCPGSIKTTNCGAAGSLTKVRNACQGKQECVLQATNNRFGDPCRGTKKYLEVRILPTVYFSVDLILCENSFPF